MRGLEGIQYPSDPVASQVGRGRQADRTGDIVRAKTDPRIELFRLGQQVECAFGQRAALFRRTERARGAVQQARAVMRLERREPFRHGGGRQAEIPRGRRHRPAVENRQEQPELIEEHCSRFPKDVFGSGSIIETNGKDYLTPNRRRPLQWRSRIRLFRLS